MFRYTLMQYIGIFTGSPIVIILCIILDIIWVSVGRLQQWSDTWQLEVSTISTLAAYWMVFILQNTKNRYTSLLHNILHNILHHNHIDDNNSDTLEQYTIKNKYFVSFVDIVCRITGSFNLFIIVVFLSFIWLGCGPIAQWNNTWQLVCSRCNLAYLYMVN